MGNRFAHCFGIRRKSPEFDTDNNKSDVLINGDVCGGRFSDKGFEKMSNPKSYEPDRNEV